MKIVIEIPNNMPSLPHIQTDFRKIKVSIGRNQKCLCGSRNKFKICCLGKVKHGFKSKEIIENKRGK